MPRLSVQNSQGIITGQPTTKSQQVQMSRVQGKSQEGGGATVKLCNLVPVLTSLDSALTQKRRVAQEPSKVV